MRAARRERPSVRKTAPRATAREAEFDAVVAIARRLFGCAIATVTLVDDQRQWFKAKVGLEGSGCVRRDSICATAMYEPELLVVPDLAADPRFADNSIVTGAPQVRFWVQRDRAVPVQGHASWRR